MEECPKCHCMTAERNHYNNKLICYSRNCIQQKDSKPMNKGIKLAKEMAKEDTKFLREVLRKEETEKEVCDNTTVKKLADIEDKVFNIEEKVDKLLDAISNIETLLNKPVK